MSTKAIRRVLNGALEHPNGGDDVRAALAEVEAIERAARTLKEWDASGNRPHPGFQAAWATLSTIAKDAK